MNGYLNKQGEIWEAEIGLVKRPVIILRDHGVFSIVLQLFDSDDYADLDVLCGKMMQANTKKLSYLADNRLIRFVRRLTDTEYSGIMQRVAEGLGLGEMGSQLPVETKVENKAESTELVELKKEAEIYKRLYEGLLERMMQ